uniref:Dynein heavy chain hydrolytic ATP-binding dynein motor region domain-containing protein n=1 Tax=Ditylenchus dipsaci TaxID=166011 RepID=A0A915CRJ9_9BILA
MLFDNDSSAALSSRWLTIWSSGNRETESVKALGHHLGRFVLVFNCDETFDFQAIGRILVWFCQVGAWAVLMSSIDWRSECSQLFLNKSKLYKNP